MGRRSTTARKPTYHVILVDDNEEALVALAGRLSAGFAQSADEYRVCIAKATRAGEFQDVLANLQRSRGELALCVAEEHLRDGGG